MFEQHCNQIRHPFVIYADFESTLQKIHTVQQDPAIAYQINLHKHVPNSFAVYTKCEVDEYSKLEVYNGLDAPKVFVQYLIEEAKRIYEHMDTNVPYNLTNDETTEYAYATVCYVCKGEFTKCVITIT